MPGIRLVLLWTCLARALKNPVTCCLGRGNETNPAFLFLASSFPLLSMHAALKLKAFTGHRLKCKAVSFLYVFEVGGFQPLPGPSLQPFTGGLARTCTIEPIKLHAQDPSTRRGPGDRLWTVLIRGLLGISACYTIASCQGQ